MFLLFCDIVRMLMSNLHTTFVREVSLETHRKFVPRVYHDQVAWPSVYSICLLFQSIRTVLAYTLIRLFFSALLAMTLIPFRGPDFWTEIRVASCDQ